MGKTAFGALCVAALMAAAPAMAQTASDTGDPLESVNRSMYSFNAAFGSAVASPLASAYNGAVPEGVRVGIDHVFTNLREPLTAVSSVLQGDLDNAGLSAGRFAINTTAGIGGLFDVASKMGWTSRPTDLGTTLCKWNMPSGPYVVLPFVGPTTVRGTVAVVATYATVFWMLEDWAVPYLVADRAVAFASDAPTGTASQEGADAYAAQRDKYLAMRAGQCASEVPAEHLKASPLGRVIEVSQ